MKNHIAYITKQKRKPALPLQAYAPLTVVIPCYNEPNILETVKSLLANEGYDEPLHIIIVINHKEGSSPDVVAQNKTTEDELLAFRNELIDKRFQISVLNIVFPKNEGGVGAARKIGMDEAIYQYSQHGKNGLLISLDADTLCSSNYLATLNTTANASPKTNTFIINYEHPLEGLAASQKEAIIQYELYLRYMVMAYRYIGHPNAFHTIGSAFAVRSDAYCKQNGMNKRQAGEDFYFLQKMLALGGCEELNSAHIIPSSRTSNRTPFGTGQSVKNLISSNSTLDVYSFKCFSELKQFFDKHELLYQIKKEDYEQIVYHELGGLIKSWLIEDDFFTELEKINANCASLRMFSKKFFESFSILRIIKYLNFAHEHFIQKVEIFHAISCLPNSEDLFNFTSSEALLQSVRRYLQTQKFVKS